MDSETFKLLQWAWDNETKLMAVGLFDEFVDRVRKTEEENDEKRRCDWNDRENM